MLLVEDNEMNRDMLSRRLTRQGFEVLVAPDGPQGIDLAGSQRPALVLTDMTLPDMDGRTATRWLRGDTRTLAVPIVG